jgi:hypothetical protein
MRMRVRADGVKTEFHAHCYVVRGDAHRNARFQNGIQSIRDHLIALCIYQHFMCNNHYITDSYIILIVR